MKSFLTITIAFLLSFLTLESFAQKKIKSPDLKIGIGYPYAFGNINEEGSNTGEVSKITGFPSLSIEKPIPIEHKRKNMFSINPGIAYYGFQEKFQYGTIVVGRDDNLNHHSLSAYSKFLYQKKFYGPSTGFIYLGAIAGFHMITKTMGTRISYGLTPGEPLVETKANEPAKDFYGTFYYGAVLGIQPKAKVTNKIKLSFEGEFFPALVKRINRNAQFHDATVAQLTVYLGLRLD